MSIFSRTKQYPKNVDWKEIYLIWFDLSVPKLYLLTDVHWNCEYGKDYLTLKSYLIFFGFTNQIFCWIFLHTKKEYHNRFFLYFLQSVQNFRLNMQIFTIFIAKCSLKCTFFPPILIFIRNFSPPLPVLVTNSMCNLNVPFPPGTCAYVGAKKTP